MAAIPLQQRVIMLFITMPGLHTGTPSSMRYDMSQLHEWADKGWNRCIRAVVLTLLVPCPETPEAFKDRMVGYDRESARRTQVLDDQSDYFDVDSNAWLSAEVCLALQAGASIVLCQFVTLSVLCTCCEFWPCQKLATCSPCAISMMTAWGLIPHNSRAGSVLAIPAAEARGRATSTAITRPCWPSIPLNAKLQHCSRHTCRSGSSSASKRLSYGPQRRPGADA